MNSHRGSFFRLKSVLLPTKMKWKKRTSIETPNSISLSLDQFACLRRGIVAVSQYFGSNALETLKGIVSFLRAKMCASCSLCISHKQDQFQLLNIATMHSIRHINDVFQSVVVFHLVSLAVARFFPPQNRTGKISFKCCIKKIFIVCGRFFDRASYAEWFGYIYIFLSSFVYDRYQNEWNERKSFLPSETHHIFHFTISFGVCVCVFFSLNFFLIWAKRYKPPQTTCGIKRKKIQILKTHTNCLAEKC